MSKTTAIQWCDATINPVMGCAGCELWSAERRTCYAGQLHRLRSRHKGFAPNFLTPKLFPGRTAQAAGWGDLTGTDRPDKPWLDGLPRLIFVSDMGDALSEKDAIDGEDGPVPGGAVPLEYLKAEVIDAAGSDRGRRHQWLWLTKRPRRMAAFGQWLAERHGVEWPPNVWAGTSVTGRATLGRVAHLDRVGDDRTTRFLSVEPLWEQVSLAGRLDGIRWVIVGGESRQGSPAREFRCDWARRLRDECRNAGVAFFVKQLGSNVTSNGTLLRLTDGHGGDWSEWPADLRLRQMPSIIRSDKRLLAPPSCAGPASS